jgi:acetyltransferase
MSVRNLERLLEPTRIAIVGAGGEHMQLGHVVLRNLLEASFRGAVCPINPHHESVGGVDAYPRIQDAPETPDLAVVCTPAATVPEVVRECGEAGVGAIAVLSAGFRETGPEGQELERRIGEELRRHEGLRLLGPNCLGLIVPRLSLNASFAAAMPTDGELAFVTQSGALATSVVDWARAERIGFSHVVSLGNMLDVDLGDVIDYLAQDRRTRAIILYVESITEPRKFMSASRAFTRSRPIIVYKSGRFAASAKAAVSHTGAMAGEDAVYDAAFRRAGLVRVGRIEDVFSTAELLAREHPVRRARLAIVTNAGGPAVIAADALIARGGALAELSPETRLALDEALPRAWPHANPVDVLGDASPARFAAAVRSTLADPGVDALLVILTPQAMTDPLGTAESLLDVRHEHAQGRHEGHRSTGPHKPMLAAWMGGASVKEGLARLATGGVAAYAYPDQAVDAFMDLVSYARNLETLHETPRSVPVSFEPAAARANAIVESALGEGGDVLSETSSKALLEAYGIPTTTPRPAGSADDAVALAEVIGYPVVLKVSSPGVTHKTEVGGVELGLATAEQVRGAYTRTLAAESATSPDGPASRETGAGGRASSVTVQPMAPATAIASGHELVLGARKDATFGAVVLLGAGGVAAEVLSDRVLGLPPLNEALVLAMLRSLRIRPLLTGYRGRPGADIDALIEVVMRFSYLVAEHPELEEIEINPLLASAEGALALDARAVIDGALVASPPPRFSHLAIRPYPEEYAREATTSDGLDVTLRPIRPEDEPRWHEMLDACSADSLHMRFRALVKHTHAMARRYCFIDYDRELAIVAELRGEEGGKLAGVGRLVAGPDHQRAEYAVLVPDPWQGRGLATLMTDYCLEIARAWGVRSVYAETTLDNVRMIAVMRAHDFALTRRVDDGIVCGERRP